MPDTPTICATRRSTAGPPRRVQRWRSRVIVVASGIACAVLLTACLQLKGDFQVKSDNTVSGEARIGVQKSLVSLAGGTDALYSQLESGGNGCSSDQSNTNVTQSRYDDGTYVGIICTFHDEPIAKLGAGSNSSDAQLSLTRDGNQFHLNGTLDIASSLSSNLGSGDTSSSPTAFPSLDPQALLKSADIQFVFEFPGKVRSASGTIDGNKVTFKPDPSGKLVMNAVADATPSGSGGGLPVSAWIGIGVAILAVVALVLLLALRRPRRPAPATAASGQEAGAEYPAGASPETPGYQPRPSGYQPPPGYQPPSGYQPPPDYQPPASYQVPPESEPPSGYRPASGYQPPSGDEPPPWGSERPPDQR